MPPNNWAASFSFSDISAGFSGAFVVLLVVDGVLMLLDDEDGIGGGGGLSGSFLLSDTGPLYPPGPHIFFPPTLRVGSDPPRPSPMERLASILSSCDTGGGVGLPGAA